jgi:biopolymer transport protein ExbD
MSSIENASAKHNLRIDFAPMVDLGFLLITFFVFTSSLLEPKAFGLHVPDEGEGTHAPLSATITLTMLENGRIDYLEGSETHVLAKGSAHLYQQQSLRRHLLDKRERIIAQLGTDEQYTVLIQPTAQTNYREIVDVLDEMTITGIKKYVLLEDKTNH